MATLSQNTRYKHCKYLRADFDWSIALPTPKRNGKPFMTQQEMNRIYDSIAKTGKFPA